MQECRINSTSKLCNTNFNPFQHNRNELSFSLFVSCGGSSVCSLLAAVPRGALSLLQVIRGQFSSHLPNQRILQPGLIRAVLPQRRDQPHPLQPHVKEVPERGVQTVRSEACSWTIGAEHSEER